MKPALPLSTHLPSTAPAALESHVGFWLRWVSNHVSQAFAAKVQARGATVTEWVLMRALLDLPEGTPGQLVQATGLTKGAVSKLVERLLHKGWLSRQASLVDRRQQHLALTPEGVQLVKDLAMAADDNEAFFFGHLSSAERQQLMHILQGLVRHHGWLDVPVD